MHRLDDILSLATLKAPQSKALLFKGESLSFEQLDKKSKNIAAYLRNLEIGKGDVVVLASANNPIFVELSFACSIIGATCAVLSVRFTAQIMSSLLDRVKPSVIFVSDDMSQLIQDALLVENETIRTVYFEREEFITELENITPTSHLCDISEQDTVLLLFTSGTTGIPKGVKLSHKALISRIPIDQSSMCLSENSCMLFVLPFFHVTCVSVFVVLASGGVVAISDSYKPIGIVSEIKRYGATHVGLLPFHMNGIANYLDKNSVSISTLKLIIYGGEQLQENVLSRLHKLLNCGFWRGYGMTEAGSSVSALSPEDHNKPGAIATVGSALPGIKIEIRNRDGEVLGVGKTGEIFIFTPTIMSGYWNDIVQTKRVLVNGWYKTGDIGFIDEGGRLNLVDRLDGMIISGGENIYPAEIAHCISEMRGIVDVAVIRIKDQKWGETPAAFVVRDCDEVPSEQDIRDYVSTRLGKYKIPRHIVFVETLKRCSSGKVSKEYLDFLASKLEEGVYID